MGVLGCPSVRECPLKRRSGIRERPGDFDRLAEGHCSAGCLFFCRSFRSEHVDEPSLEEDDEFEVVYGWRELTNFVQPNACSPKTGSGSRVFRWPRRPSGGREGKLVVRRPGGVHQQFDYLTKRGPRPFRAGGPRQGQPSRDLKSPCSGVVGSIRRFLAKAE